MSLEALLLVASSVISTTYGYDELFCGDIGKPIPCSIGATTASGLPFDPNYPMIAIAAPTSFRLQARVIYVKLVGSSKCHAVLLADKMSPRFISERGFDITPAAQRLLTGEDPSPTWSGYIEVCWRSSNLTKPKQVPSQFYKPL